MTDGWTTEDLVFQWRKGDPVQVAKNMHLPRFMLERYEADYCHSVTNTGKKSPTHLRNPISQLLAFLRQQHEQEKKIETNIVQVRNLIAWLDARQPYLTDGSALLEMHPIKTSSRQELANMTSVGIPRQQMSMLIKECLESG